MTVTRGLRPPSRRPTLRSARAPWRSVPLPVGVAAARLDAPERVAIRAIPAQPVVNHEAEGRDDRQRRFRASDPSRRAAAHPVPRVLGRLDHGACGCGPRHRHRSRCYRRTRLRSGSSLPAAFISRRIVRDGTSSLREASGVVPATGRANNLPAVLAAAFLAGQILSAAFGPSLPLRSRAMPAARSSPSSIAVKAAMGAT